MSQLHAGRGDGPGCRLRVVRPLGLIGRKWIGSVQRIEVLAHRAAALGGLAPLRDLGARNIERANVE